MNVITGNEHQDRITGSVMMVHVNQEHLDRIAEAPVTVLSQQDWIILFVVMVDVNREHPVRVAEPPATVLSEMIWIHRMLFVVKGSANVVYAVIIVVKIVTVLKRRVVLVFITHNVVVTVPKSDHAVRRRETLCIILSQ